MINLQQYIYPKLLEKKNTKSYNIFDKVSHNNINPRKLLNLTKKFTKSFKEKYEISQNILTQIPIIIPIFLWCQR